MYDDTGFNPVAKLQDGKRYTLVNDYLGTPIQAYDDAGNLVWDCQLDIYGKEEQLKGDKSFIPFRYQGQYEDEETGLYYNRFRYYSPDEGMYISQDPIGLAGGNPTLYGYVFDSNTEVDIWGLDILQDAWKEVLKNANNSNLTVLGHFPRKNLGETFESYIEKAIRKQANYFNIGDMWDEVAKVTDPWVLNERFLKLITERGDNILLNVNKNSIRPNSYL